MKRRIACVAFVAALALAGVASAHVKYFPSTLHAELRPGPGGTVIEGEMVSVNKKCNADRTIVVTASGGEVIGRGKSDADGHFEFPATEVPRGSVTAEAKQIRIAPKTKKHKHYCLPGRTPVLVRH